MKASGSSSSHISDIFRHQIRLQIYIYIVANFDIKLYFYYLFTKRHRVHIKLMIHGYIFNANTDGECPL